MMKLILVVAITVCVWATSYAQTGSVHCGVGCVCSEFAKEVCGSDGLTYLNECVLRCRKCDFPELLLKHEGKCEIYRGEIPFSYQYAPGYFPWGYNYKGYNHGLGYDYRYLPVSGVDPVYTRFVRSANKED